MRTTFPRPSASAVLGAALLLAGCSTGGALRVGVLPVGDRSTVAQALRCEAVPASGPVTMTVAGGGEGVLRYPEKSPVAILTVPRGAVDAPTTFTLSAPATQRVLIVATAADATGRAVTEFRSEPLRLVLHLRDGCTPRRPARDSSFFAYRFIPSDSTFDERGGKWDDANFWEFFWQRTARVSAALDHLSGYILAQGDR